MKKTREELLQRLHELEQDLKGEQTTDDQRSDILDEISDIEIAVYGHNPATEEMGTLVSVWRQSKRRAAG